jgi:hypothetical protein
LGLSGATKHRHGAGDERAQSEIALLAQLVESRVALLGSSNKDPN